MNSICIVVGYMIILKYLEDLTITVYNILLKICKDILTKTAKSKPHVDWCSIF